MQIHIINQYTNNYMYLHIKINESINLYLIAYK